MKIVFPPNYLSTRTSLLIILLFMLGGCQEFPPPVRAYLPPGHRNITLEATTDTLHFALDTDVYNSVRSLNHFVENGKEYVVFHDKVSSNVSVYDFSTSALVKKIRLKNILPYRSLSKKTTVFVKNSDSLFVCNKDMIYLFNGELKLLDSISLLSKPYVALTSFRSQAPPYFSNGKMYLRTSPYLSAKKRKDYKKWKSIYELDFVEGKARIMYELPKRYQDSLYGYYFFETSYCVNHNNRLVFSYAADSNLYETDLVEYHVAHNAKSRFYQGDIVAVEDSAAKIKDGMKVAFMQRDSYGDIYFDPGARRYLRVAEQKLTERDLLLGAKGKEKTLIVLDEEFRTIGEGKLPKNLSLSTLFITPSGHMYVRVRGSDQSTIHLARLAYKEDSVQPQLAKHP